MYYRAVYHFDTENGGELDQNMKDILIRLFNDRYNEYCTLSNSRTESFNKEAEDANDPYNIFMRSKFQEIADEVMETVGGFYSTGNIECYIDEHFQFHMVFKFGNGAKYDIWFDLEEVQA